MTVSPGARLGPYEIVSLVGSGGMGEVYSARDLRLDRIVAIKVLRPQALADPHRRPRFEREARTISRLNHPHICTLFDVGHQDGTDYLVMEYLDGQTLAERLEQGPLPLEDAFQYAIQIVDALNAAHEQAVVHRDLKPANIMLTKAGTKLLDFGIAKAIGPPKGGHHVLTGELSSVRSVRLQADRDDVPTTPPTLTVEGTLLGTVQYMSPEQLEGRNADARSDLFAFGAVLYEMLTGRRAFTGESQSRVIAAVLDTEPPPISASHPLVPPALDRLVKTCLAKNPDERWQHAGDVRRELQAIAVGSGKNDAPRRLSKYAVAATVAIVFAASAVFLWQRMKATPLTEKDVLVLADSTNTTGDAVFDGALRAALAIQLEQSPFLKVMDEQQVRQDLQFMGRPAEERITSEIAREICQREGEKAIIGGSIASLGKAYLVAIEATNCQTGETLAREQTQAEDKEHVLPAVARAATGIRAKLGESLGSIQKLDRPMGQATTPSLEALNDYSLGSALYFRGEAAAAIPFFKKATELDPDFAMGWEMLGLSYLGPGAISGGRAHAIDSEIKAFELRDRVTESEKFMIVSNYYRDVTFDLKRNADMALVRARTHPRDDRPHYVLGQFYTFAGRFEEAMREFEECYRLQRRVVPVYAALMRTYARLELIDKAKGVAKEALVQKLDGPPIHLELLAVAYRQNDQAAGKAETQWLTGRPEEYQSLNSQAGYAKMFGQRRKAGELLQRAADVARQQNLPDAAAQQLAPDPLGDALLGDCETARNHPPGPPGQVIFAMALCGDTEAARKAADVQSSRAPDNTPWNAVGLPAVRAAIELRSEQPVKAIEALKPAAAYERGQPQIVYLRGLIYLNLHEGAQATREFRTIVDRQAENWGLYFPLSYVGLARAATLEGDTAKARKAYEDFFALWKDADSDTPILIEARKEYAALKGN